MHQFTKFCLLSFLGFSIFACNNEPKASETTDNFFSLLKEAKQEEALKLMDSQMAEAVSNMLTTKNEQGSLKSFEKTSENETKTDDGSYWTFNYKTDYEKNSFYEELEVAKRDEQFVIVAYKYDTHPFEETKAKTKQVETFVSTLYELQSTDNYVAILEMIDEEALKNTTSAEWEMMLMNKQTTMGRLRGFDPAPRQFQRGEYEDGVGTFTAGFLVSYEKGDLYEIWTLINRGHNYKILSHQYENATTALQ